MATISFFLDKRSVKKDGTSPVKLSVSLGRGKQFVMGTNISLAPEMWDSDRQQVTKECPRQKTYNSVLGMIRINSENFLLNSKGLSSLGVQEIKKKMEAALSGGGTVEEPDSEERPYTFSDAFNDFSKCINKQKTREVYQTTFNKLSKFTDLSTLAMEEITVSWLRSLESWLSSTSSVNTISIHMRNIRAIMNFAIDEERISNYPFRKYRIKTEQTEKRSLTVEKLAELRDYPCKRCQKPYRDIFMLMFYLIGINAVDLFHLKEKDVRNGRIVYRREKTGKLYSIKVEPEAQEIIDRYKGENYLIDPLDTYKNYVDFSHRMNENLRKIGKVTRSGRGGKETITPAFPGITAYWSRHTWATIAASLDIPKETIAAALGHEIGNPTTSIYIDFNRKKVDEANRKVIDYVNGFNGGIL